jgi:acyl carrier protein
MTNREKYDQAFMESLGIGAEKLGAALTYQSVPGWDSVGHMSLVAALEAAFDIAMEMDDVIDLSSYLKGIETLAKYGVAV